MFLRAAGAPASYLLSCSSIFLAQLYCQVAPGLLQITSDCRKQRGPCEWGAGQAPSCHHLRSKASRQQCRERVGECLD